MTIRDGDATGRGEGVPYPRYGETIEGTLAAIEQVRAADRAGRRGGPQLLDALAGGGGAQRGRLRLVGSGGAAGRAATWRRMIGGPALHAVPSAMTVVIDTPEAMARGGGQAGGRAGAQGQGGRGRSGGRRSARSGPRRRSADLIVDPNESWDRALLEAMQPVLVEALVGLLEQPVPAGADEWLEGFSSAVPICADESVHVAADLAIVARRYQAVNVKLDKAGGLTAALELAQAARARGLGLMTGCMVSSSLSIAPALHLADDLGLRRP